MVRIGLAVVSVMLVAIPASLSAQVPTPSPMASPDEEDAILAAIRIKGYDCETPTAMSPDFSASSRLEPAWLVTCESGRYRVIFVGDEGPKVEPVK